MTAPVKPVIRKMGPGLLSFGSAGSTQDISKRVTSIKVAWSVDAEDDTPVLSGDVEAGDRTYTATLEATLYQDDLRDGEFTAWTWEHKGEVVPFEFAPFTDGDNRITGDAQVDPLDVGGDVGKKNTTDIKWACLGEPELTSAL